MAQENEMGASPVTEHVSAPNPVMPRMKQVERMGDIGAPYSRRYPRVIGGICEFCGVMDNRYPSEFQYKMCPHFRGMQLRCSYCPASKNPDDVINHSQMNIAEHPDNPDKLVVWCNSYECSKKHTERFQVSS